MKNGHNYDTCITEQTTMTHELRWACKLKFNVSNFFPHQKTTNRVTCQIPTSLVCYSLQIELVSCTQGLFFRVVDLPTSVLEMFYRYTIDNNPYFTMFSYLQVEN